MNPFRRAAVPRTLIWLGVVCLCSLASAARAQESTVVILAPANDPIARAISLELSQRGLQPSFDEPARLASPEEAWTRAVVMGADAVVWIDARPEDNAIIVRSMRIRDAELDEAVVSMSDLSADVRIAALIAAALTSELLARQPAHPTARMPSDSEPDAALESSPDEMKPVESSIRAYGTLMLEHLLRMVPVNGGAGVRLAIGLELPDGIRVGVQARGMGIFEIDQGDHFYRSAPAPHALLGAELELRIPISSFAMIVGVSASAGAYESIQSRTSGWTFAVAFGAVTAITFAVGQRDDSIGIELGIDGVYVAAQELSPVGSLSLR